MGVALLFLSSLSPTLSFRPAVVAPGTAARGAVKSYSSYSSNGQIWGPEGTAGGLGEPAVAEDKPAATVPDGTLWAYTGRLRTEEKNVRQEFGGDRVATFDLDPTTMTGITKPTGFWDPLGFTNGCGTALERRCARNSHAHAAVRICHARTRCIRTRFARTAPHAQFPSPLLATPAISHSLLCAPAAPPRAASSSTARSS